jgi:hypothetical protein
MLADISKNSTAIVKDLIGFQLLNSNKNPQLSVNFQDNYLNASNDLS